MVADSLVLATMTVVSDRLQGPALARCGDHWNPAERHQSSAHYAGKLCFTISRGNLTAFHD